MPDQVSELDELRRRLDSLELRLKNLESVPAASGKDILSGSPVILPETATPAIETENVEEKGLESQIGRFGLSWLGNIVLLFGITFLTQLMMIQGHRFFSIFTGYAAVLILYSVGKYISKTNNHLAFIFNLNSQILLYYTTLRLHFFSASPLIPDKTVSLVLLMLLVIFQVYLSIRNRSQAYATLSVIFALFTGIVSDETGFLLPIAVLTAAGTVYYYYRFKWEPLLIASIILIYCCFTIWLFGNPVMGHPGELIREKQSSVLFLFAPGACFSALVLLRKKDSSSDDFLIGTTVLNGIIFTTLLVLIALRFYSNNYVTLFSIISLSCLIYSVVLHSGSEWNFATAFYSLYGFMAMSIAFCGLFGFPEVYMFLSVQSLLVVSLALWFRNKLIVVMNSILFLAILLVYFFSSEGTDGANFSFALISLVSARIINWKKSRLQIKTDFMRNLYLIEGFLMVLFALFNAMPRHFVTLSWTAAALLYFLLSFILRNVKYRYMALGTMICAAFYLFLVDLSRIELIFRVLALLSLAAISIGISIYYTNRVKNYREKNHQE